MGHVTLSIAPFSVTAVSAPTREHTDGCWPAVQHALLLSFPHAYDTQQMEKEKYKTKNKTKTRNKATKQRFFNSMVDNNSHRSPISVMPILSILRMNDASILKLCSKRRQFVYVLTSNCCFLQGVDVSSCSTLNCSISF